MHTAKRNRIFQGTIAVIWLIFWFLFCRLAFTGHSSSSSSYETVNGISREITVYDPNPLKREYTLPMIAGLYGAAVASVVVFRTRAKREKPLMMIVVAPLIAVATGILLLMLSTAIFYPADSSLYSNEVTRRLFPALGVVVYAGIGLSGFIIVPAVLAAWATRCFLEVFSRNAGAPPPLPVQE